jgi:hypothetical protein
VIATISYGRGESSLKFKQKLARRAASEVVHTSALMIHQGRFLAEKLLDENFARDPSVRVGPMTRSLTSKEVALLRQRLERVGDMEKDIHKIANHLRMTSHVPLGTRGAHR